MPATPEVVDAFLAAAGAGYPQPSPTPPGRSNCPCLLHRGIGGKHGTPPRRSDALTIADKRKLVRACGATLVGARDWALFLVGFAGALRRSELVGMNVADITWTEDSLVLLITRSKTEAEGAGARIGISRGKAVETCPVTTLHDWLTKAGIDDGSVFRRVNRGGAIEQGRLTAGAVRQVLVKRAGQAGITNTWAEPVSPHGLRAGFVTAAYRNGVPDEEIMGHTRHRSLTSMRTYVRRAKLGNASPSGKVGL